MRNILHLSWIAASVPKPGSRAEENEDALAADPDELRFAISDGASEGWNSGGWARHLAKSFIELPPSPADFSCWLSDMRAMWSPSPADGSWYAEEKAGEGSFATLLGVAFHGTADPPGFAYKTVAVGDSCFFIVRGEKLEVAFPLAHAREFGNQPPLVPSATGRECPEPEWLAGRCEPGDLFLLATDAVARALLKAGEDVGNHTLVKAAFTALASDSPDPVLELLKSLGPKLKDDATVVAVRLAGRSMT